MADAAAGAGAGAEETREKRGERNAILAVETAADARTRPCRCSLSSGLCDCALGSGASAMMPPAWEFA